MHSLVTHSLEGRIVCEAWSPRGACGGAVVSSDCGRELDCSQISGGFASV